MKYVRNHLRVRQARAAEDQLFGRIAFTSATPEALAFLSALTSFVALFHDTLQQAEDRSQGPMSARAVASLQATTWRAEVSNDVWFLHELCGLEGPEHGLPEVRAALAPDDEAVSDAAYALADRVLRANDDRACIALMLVLEATGHVLFQRLLAYFHRIEYKRPVWYFAREPLAVDLGEEIFEKEMEETFDPVELLREERAALVSAIDRCFDTISIDVDALFDDKARAEPEPPSAPPASVLVARARRAASEGVVFQLAG